MTIRRRHLLRLAGVAGAATLAGCSGLSDDEGVDDSRADDDEPIDDRDDDEDEADGVDDSHLPVGTAIEDRPIERRIGSNHVNPTYRFESDIDVLNEGAAVLEELGVSVISCWLHEPDVYYDLSTDWEPVRSLREAAEHPYFDELFRRDFDTYVLTAHSHHGETSQTGGYFIYGISEDEAAEERAEFFDLTTYLLETYDGTGSEFILMNWELDNIIAGTGEDRSWDPTAVEDTITWMNARQRGIVEARESVESDVAVLGACEIVDVFPAMEDGEEWAINTIVPELEVDLIGFSSHGQIDHEAGHVLRELDEVTERVYETLDYIEAQAPEPTPYLRSVMGDDVRPVFLSEFGQPEVRDDYIDVMQAFRVVPPAIEWGCPLLLYWTLFDNEVSIDGEVQGEVSENELEVAFGGQPGPEDVVGWYLIDPAGDPGTRWYLFENLLADPEGFELSFPHLMDIYTTFIGASDVFHVRLDYDRVILESELNPDIPEEDARKLAVALSDLVLHAGEKELGYDLDDEQFVIEYGAHEPESDGAGETFRWFGTDEAATSIYLLSDDHTAQPSKLELTGWAAEGTIDVDVTVDGKYVERVSFDEERDTFSIVW